MKSVRVPYTKTAKLKSPPARFTIRFAPFPAPSVSRYRPGMHDNTVALMICVGWALFVVAVGVVLFLVIEYQRRSRLLLEEREREGRRNPASPRR
jgi:hypothetical protein